MKKTAQKYFVRESLLFRSLVGIIMTVLLTVKVVSPFLHSHDSLVSSQKEISTLQHCDACEFESTQAVEPGVIIKLPIADFYYKETAFQTQSPFVSQSHSSSESRGPPQNS